MPQADAFFSLTYMLERFRHAILACALICLCDDAISPGSRMRCHGAFMCSTIMMRDLIPALRVLLLARIILCVNAPFYDTKALR
jgi:hypothetical protein